MVPYSSAIIHTLFQKREGSIITGTNPTAFTTTDPLRLWIIQVGIIIVTAQLLSLCLRRLKQPRFIAEVLAGILLGPTALGRIPGFTEHIFPPVSLPYLSLVGNIGLCLYLFLVGLAIDTSIIRRNARMSVIVCLATVAVPFSLGSVLSVPLYHNFVDPSIRFAYFMLFVGVAYSITAFPVLYPILTDLKLLNTHIGIVAISAGVGSTITGWILLALGMALIDADPGLTALWILFICIFFTFLLIPVKLTLRWLACKTGSIDNGPSTFFMTIVVILLLACCLFTDIIGMNAILGAFLFGLIIPREGGLAITLVEKLEDIVSIIFLPTYYTFSGLNTNLRLLDDGVTWAFTIAIIAISLSGKFGGCTIVSRLAGYGWRESSMIGALMSCKGLLELVVLNVGLQAGVLSQRVFSMFIFKALTLTFFTTPLVNALCLPKCRIPVGEAASHLNDNKYGEPGEKETILTEEQPWRHRFTVVLDKLDHISSAMALMQLVLLLRNVPLDSMSTTTIDTSGRFKMPDVSVDALHLIELSDRTSAMMKSSAADNLAHTDPMSDIFRMFGELNELAVTTSLLVVPYDDFACSVAEHAHKHASHFILLPWSLPMVAVVDTPDGTCTTPGSPKNDHNPLDVVFGGVLGQKTDRFSSVIQSQFVRGVFAQSKTDVALFINAGDRPGVCLNGPSHIFLPFFGGPDNRLALDFVVQLCLDPRVTVTVVRIVKQGELVDEGAGRKVELLTPPPMAHLVEQEGMAGGRVNLRVDPLARPQPTAQLQDRLDTPGPLSAISTQTFGFPDTVPGQSMTQVRLESETADHIAWSKYATPASFSDASSSTKNDVTNTQGLRQVLARINFSDAHTSAPLHTAIGHARALQETSSRLLIVTGRSRRLLCENHRAEMRRVLETSRSGVGAVLLEGMRKTVGDVAIAMTVAIGRSASAVVVLQAAHVTQD